MPELGRAALVVCLGLALYALLVGGYAAATRKRRLARSAQNALFAAVASTVVATIVLLAALLRHDFSFAYVAEHTSRRLPTPYTISAFWGGQEGSLLLWLLILTGLSALAVVLARRAAGDLIAWVVPVLGLVATFFAFMLVAVSSPFATQAATAFLHSVMIQEKRGMLKVWNVLLVVLAFCLALFGTFLTRSGVVSSIHSFTQSPLGAWFLGFICLIAIGSLALILNRLPILCSKTRMESLVSREATFLYNNLLLVALCLTILWGVIFPILSEAVRGEQITVSGPYYNFFLRIFGLPLLLLMGIGPLVAWRRASLRSLGRSFAWPAAIGLAVGIVLLLLGAGSSWIGLLAYTFSAFVLGSIGYAFVRGTRARHALTGGPWLAAFSELVARNRRRYGGYIVHAAIVLLAIGVAGSSAYDKVRERTLSAGGSMSVGHYGLTYNKLVRQQGANDTEFRALLDVRKNGNPIGTVKSGKNS